MRKKLSIENFPIQQLEQYISKTVLPKMEISKRHFTLEPTSLGNRNVIFFITVENDQTYVLKGFTKKDRIKNNVIANRFLVRSSISVPPILFSDISQKTYKKFGCFFSCEVKINGKSLADVTNIARAIPKVAEFYSQMHNIRSSRWGKFTSGKKYGFYQYIMKKAGDRLSAIADTGILPRHENRETYMRWFENRKAVLNKIRIFSLCHGDANLTNIFLSGNSRIVIIDNEAIKYIPFPLEFYRLLFTLCRNDGEMQKNFEDVYFTNCSPQRRAEFEEYGFFFKAYVLLELAWYYNKQYKKQNQEENTRNSCKEMATMYLSELNDYISATTLVQKR